VPIADARAEGSDEHTPGGQMTTSQGETRPQANGGSTIVAASPQPRATKL
jgi:hypothetical protein